MALDGGAAGSLRSRSQLARGWAGRAQVLHPIRTWGRPPASFLRELFSDSELLGGRCSYFANGAYRPDKLLADSTDATGAPGLLDRGAARARDAGIDPHHLVADVLSASADHRPRIVGDPETAAVVTERLLGPVGLTEHATSFNRADVTGPCANTPPPAHPSTTTGCRRSPTRCSATPTPYPWTRRARVRGAASAGRWTTRELLAVEAGALDLAAALRTAEDSGVDPALTEERIDAATLNGDQADMVRALTGRGARLRVVIGPAGSGKTAAMEVAFRAWRAQDRSVHGCAPVRARRPGPARRHRDARHLRRGDAGLDMAIRRPDDSSIPSDQIARLIGG
jgi:hypothetical protein